MARKETDPRWRIERNVYRWYCESNGRHYADYFYKDWIGVYHIHYRSEPFCENPKGKMRAVAPATLYSSDFIARLAFSAGMKLVLPESQSLAAKQEAIKSGELEPLVTEVSK